MQMFHLSETEPLSKTLSCVSSQKRGPGEQEQDLNDCQTDFSKKGLLKSLVTPPNILQDGAKYIKDNIAEFT